MLNRKDTAASRFVPQAPVMEALENRLLLDAAWSGVDMDGDLLKVTLVGEGGMTVTQPSRSPGNIQGILKLQLTETEGCNTILTIAVTRSGGGDGLVNVGRITGGANCGIHMLNGAQVNIVGTATAVPNLPNGDGSGYGIDLQGYLRNAVLHDIRNGADIWAKQTGVWYPNCAPSTLAINDIGNGTTITLGSRLEKFTLNSWGVSGGLDVKSIGTMAVKGNFGSDITTLREIGTITVGGAVNGISTNLATWTVPRDVGAVKLGSSGPYFSTNITGAVTSLTVAGGMGFSQWKSSSLGPLSVKGDMTGGTFRLTQAMNPQDPKQLTLKSATIGGAVSGAWNIAGHTGALKVGSTVGGFDATIAGDVPSLTVGGAMNFHDWTSRTLGTLAVKTTMTSVGTMSLTQGVLAGKTSLGKVTVGSWMTDVSVRSAGNIGSVTAAGMNRVNVFAGVKPAVVNLLASSAASSYLSSEATIASVTVKGVPGAHPWERHSMYDTDIIAAHLGKLSFFGPEVGSGLNGVAGKTIIALSMQKPDGTKYKWNNPWPADASSRINTKVLT